MKKLGEQLRVDRRKLLEKLGISESEIARILSDLEYLDRRLMQRLYEAEAEYQQARQDAMKAWQDELDRELAIAIEEYEHKRAQHDHS